MPKSAEYGVPNLDNPEWTKERMKKAMRLSDLSPEIQAVLAPKRMRGPQRATKKLTAIRLSADVLEAMRATGRGWQTRADDTLRRHFVAREGETTSG